MAGEGKARSRPSPSSREGAIRLQFLPYPQCLYLAEDTTQEEQKPEARFQEHRLGEQKPEARFQEHRLEEQKPEARLQERRPEGVAEDIRIGAQVVVRQRSHTG